MSVSSEPKISTFTSSGVITAYSFVKFGATKNLVALCGANERAIGIYQGSASSANGNSVEVALPGGGALLKVSETIGLGKMLTSTTAGFGEVVDAAGEWTGAIAYEDGSANDVIGVEVVGFQAVGSDA